MKLKLTIFAAVVCMGSTVATDAQPVRDVTLATGTNAINDTIESYGLLGEPMASRPVGQRALGALDEAALMRLSTLALSTKLSGLPMLMLPEEPYLALVKGDSVAANGAGAKPADVRARRGAAADATDQPEESSQRDENRFAPGTTWRRRPGSRENSLMGPPADLMTEPLFVGPPIERAIVPMFETPIAATIETPAAELPDAPPVPAEVPAQPPQVADPVAPTAIAPLTETPSGNKPPGDNRAPILVADLGSSPQSPGDQMPDDSYPDDGYPDGEYPIEYPDDEYPDDEVPDAEYPEDEGDGEFPPPVQVPEATTLLLVGVGLAVMALLSRRRQRRGPAA